ncbi:hypothetical protein FRC17_001360 [Serendipita sp. 399]|nr:hypothetical protein FRC17_001360 [Serendipita sp. 399]
MPGHYRTRSTQRSASVPPSSPPLVFRSSHAVRVKARKTPIVPSPRRLRILETRAESVQSTHLQSALDLCGPRRSSAPTVLGPSIVLETSPETAGQHEEEEEDDDVFIIHKGYERQPNCWFPSMEDHAFDWPEHLEESPQSRYAYGQRPTHKQKRSSSSSVNMHLLRPTPYGKLQPTLLSATPSPAVSALNSPVPSPLTRALTLNMDSDLEMLMPSMPLSGWPTTSGAATDGMGMPTPGGFLSTPALSTPALSPSASISVPGSPYVGVDASGGNTSAYGGHDYFSLHRSQVPRTPAHPRPVPQ